MSIHWNLIFLFILFIILCVFIYYFDFQVCLAVIILRLYSILAPGNGRLYQPLFLSFWRFLAFFPNQFHIAFLLFCMSTDLFHFDLKTYCGSCFSPLFHLAVCFSLTCHNSVVAKNCPSSQMASFIWKMFWPLKLLNLFIWDIASRVFLFSSKAIFFHWKNILWYQWRIYFQKRQKISLPFEKQYLYQTGILACLQ